MTRITTSIDAGEVVRTIAIDYGTSTATELSRISSITLSGAQSDGTPALPPTTLVWQDVASPSFDIGARSTLDPSTTAFRSTDAALRTIVAMV